MFPSPRLFLSAHIGPNQEMGIVASGADVLTLVHPGRRIELFQQPVSAGELMRKYPRHCIARPDVFEFPWIAVHPEAILPCGCVFFLVPYYTIHSLLKSRRQQQQQQQKYNPNLHCLSYNRSDHEESWGAGNLYRFIGRLMKRNMKQTEESGYYQSVSPVDSSRRPRVTSGELADLLRIKPCLRQPESGRKNFNLRVTFFDPTAISSSWRGFPCDQALQV